MMTMRKLNLLTFINNWNLILRVYNSKNNVISKKKSLESMKPKNYFKILKNTPGFAKAKAYFKNKLKNSFINKKSDSSNKLKKSFVNKKFDNSNKYKKLTFFWTDFNIFYLLKYFLFNNSKYYGIPQAQKSIEKRLKQIYFIDAENIELLYRTIDIWFSLYFQDDFFSRLKPKAPSNRRKWRWKSRKHYKYFRYFIKKPHQLNRVRTTYLDSIGRLLFYNFRLRHFWYKKTIFLRFLAKFYQIKKKKNRFFKKKIFFYKT